MKCGKGRILTWGRSDFLYLSKGYFNSKNGNNLQNDDGVRWINNMLYNTRTFQIHLNKALHTQRSSKQSNAASNPRNIFEQKHLCSILKVFSLISNA